MTGIDHIKNDLGPIALIIFNELKNKSIPKREFALLFWVNPRAGIWNKKVKPILKEPLHSQIFSITNDKWSINHPVNWSMDGKNGVMDHPHLPLEVIIAEDIESAALRMNQFIEKRMKENGQEIVVVSGGGDGTHRTVASLLIDLVVDMDDETQSRISFLRLPLGSGNDGSCTPETHHFFELLQQGFTKKPLEFSSIELNSNKVHRSINVLSIGMDAYVAHLNNKLKKILWGNVYKKVADLAMVFYPNKKQLGPVTIESAVVNSSNSFKWTGPLGLLAFSTSGHRIYGQGYHILPDERNCCIIEMDSLFKNAALKPKILSGQHIHTARVSMSTMNSLTLHYDKSIWFQCDGESERLEPSDFPLEIKRAQCAISELWPTSL